MAIIAAYQHDVTDEAGELLSNVTVRVVSEGNGALPKLYAGPNTATDTALGNPYVQADGKVYFHVTGGTYKITVSAAGQADRVLRHVPIGRAQGTDLQLTTPMGAWSALATYNKGNLVSHTGTTLFVSLVDSNLNNEPDATTPGDTASWMYVGSAAKGDTGDPGADGDNVVWLAAAGAPAAGTGADGDMYLDTATGDVYGPKAAGAWGAVAANIKGVKGDTGDTGPANSLAIGTVTGGAAADATITGAAPTQTLNLVLPKGDAGTNGADGNDGWTPVLAIVADGARYVQQVVDWTGGEGAKPATGKYVGPLGLVDLIGDGVDIRGPSGAGTGDVVGPAGAVDGNFAAFDTATGKLIKDSGRAVGSAAGNIPVLDGSGKLDTSILPALAITDTFVVASQAAMLALVAEKGDVAIRSDLNRCFILSTNSPSTLADWKELLTPTDLVQSVAGLTGAISAGALKTALAIGDAASLGVASQTEAEAGTAADKAMTPQRTAQAIAALATGGAFVLGFFPHDNEPPSANYAIADLRNGRPILAFDDTTAWSAIFTGLLPASYGGGGLTVNVHWMAAATSGTVGWTVEIERGDASGTDFDADSFAAAQTITAATVPATSGQMVATTVSISAGANMDSLAAGELFRLRLTRDVANDTAAGNAQVLLVEVKET